MTQIICPRCNERIIVDPNCSDYEHECNSKNTTLNNEDVVKTGDWSDYTGSGTEKNVMLQGSENKLFGSRAAIQGEDVEDLTKRGKRKSTHRTRQHIQYINIDGCKLD